MRASALLVPALLLTLAAPAAAQQFTWTRSTATALPDGVAFYTGVWESPSGPVRAFYADFDLRTTNYQLKPIFTTGQKPEATAAAAKAVVLTNGGFFGSSGTSSFSLALVDSVLKTSNIAAVTRGTTSYYPTRAAMGVYRNSSPTARTMDATWVYTVGSTLYSYPTPNPNTTTVAAPQPTATSPAGATPWTVTDAIGGGPMLLQNGAARITYDEEVMFGSGVGLDNGDPRTALGTTGDRHAILFVVDGRQAGYSVGLSLPQVAETLRQLGCTEAINLDGGGSSAMVVGGTVVNRPSDGTTRVMPTTVAIVPATPPATKPTFERIFDTGDGAAIYREFGTGWTETANAGFYGTTKARLHPTGSAAIRGVFYPKIDREATYELSAWWVASGNRAKDTPITVYHRGVGQTVRVDQTSGGSSWVKVGTTFALAPGDSVAFSADATAGAATTYIVTDAIRLQSFDPTLPVAEHLPPVPTRFALLPAAPNPFNPTTRIGYRLASPAPVRLTVYDVLGRRVRTLIDARQPAGEHEATFDGSDLSSGLYLVQLVAGDFSQTRRLTLLR